MPKAHRTPNQKKTYQGVIDIFREKRKESSEGRGAVVNLFHTLKDTEKYKTMREGVTMDQIFKDLADFLDKEKRKEDIKGEIYVLFQMLQDDKLELTDEQNKLIKGIILLGFIGHDTYLSACDIPLKEWGNGYVGRSLGERNMSINFLCANFKRFSQQDREEIISKIKNKVHEGQKVELYEEKSDSLGFYPNKCRFDLHHSFYTEKLHGKAGISPNIIQPLIVETLKNSTNEELIFEIFWYLREYDKNKIPQNCISEYSNMEKLKKYITPKILDDRVTPNKVLKILNHLGLTITWDVAEQRSGHVITRGHWNDSNVYVDVGAEVNKLSEKVIQKDTVKEALSSIIENCSKEDLKKFKQYFPSKIIWGLLDDKYKKPEFVNKHMDALEPILDEDGIKVLSQEFEESTKGKNLSDSEKFHRDVKMPWEYTDLTTLEKKDFLFNGSNSLYHFMKAQKLLGTEYLDGILKLYGYPKTHGVYFMLKYKGDVPKDFLEGVLDIHPFYTKILSSEEATAFMQDIYATQDENLVKKLFDRIGEFSEYCSQEEINILIRKMIKAISSKEDFQRFYSQMESHAYSEKFGIFLDIKYLLTGSLDRYKLREHKTEIPSDIYTSLILSKIIDIDDEELPKVGPSVLANSDDLMKLSRYYAEMIEDDKKAKQEAEKAEQQRLARIRMEEEETQRIYDKAVKNRENGEVVFENYVKDSIFNGQKYVLSVDRKKHILKFITAPMDNFPYHSNLHSTYIKDGRCLGGGLIDKNDEKKVITLRGHSESYGSLSGKGRVAMKQMLEKKFPDYKIIM